MMTSSGTRLKREHAAIAAQGMTLAWLNSLVALAPSITVQQVAYRSDEEEDQYWRWRDLDAIEKEDLGVHDAFGTPCMAG